ncbi:hypothetical protein [Oligoflexus tunisiensis]|uniref:hypothetical protein n=1 Tax=Oligoflexus tunisiensis TaxID=708132 RepID=UPI00114D2C38|nr:hypothetical protein [Oligoflexus tunisiensis]
MRWLILILALHAGTAWSQVPDSGVFRYELFDNSDHPAGTYSFTITRDGPLWNINSEMDVDARVFFLKVTLRDHNSFTHDGQSFRSFQVNYFKDVPFQKTIHQQVQGRREENVWHISSQINSQKSEKTLAAAAFDEVRNLISRLIRPEAILLPGHTRSTRSLDPLTLEIDPVTSRGLHEESIEFQGKKRRLHVMVQEAPDGDVTVKKFDNGLIYRSQTAEGYALLKSAMTPNF